MKKKVLIAAGVCALVVLAGCASLVNKEVDELTTAFLPDGAVQWLPKLNDWSDSDRVKGGLSKEEYLKKAREYILWVARSSKAELAQRGKKVFQNPDAEGNPLYQRLEARLRALPPGTRVIYGCLLNDGRPNAFAVGFLSDDGSFINYVVED